MTQISDNFAMGCEAGGTNVAVGGGNGRCGGGPGSVEPSLSDTNLCGRVGLDGGTGSGTSSLQLLGLSFRTCAWACVAIEGIGAMLH